MSHNLVNFISKHYKWKVLYMKKFKLSLLLKMKKTSAATPSKGKKIEYNKENSANPGQGKRPGHRKSSSYQPDCNVSPYKSRFDLDYIPVLGANRSVVKYETCQFNSLRKKQESEDQRRRQIEWFKARKNMKKLVEDAAKLHECERNVEVSERERERERDKEEVRKVESCDKIQDFIEFNQAKKRVLQGEKSKDKEYLEIEREKSLKTQKEIQEKKAKLAKEREEKRKSFLETLAAKKQLKSSEKTRECKELQYDTAVYYLGERNLALYKTSF